MNISEYAEGMLGYKESLGFSKGTYYYYIKDFCDYFKRNGYSQFTEDTVNPWCVMRPTESPEGFRRRITPLREFSKYLCAIGVTDYVIPSSIFPITHRKAPYIITDQELIADYVKLDKKAFIRIVEETQKSQSSVDISKAKAKLKANGKRLDELEKLICRIYEDNILGRIPDERFHTMSLGYEKEKAELEKENDALEAEIAEASIDTDGANKFIALIEKYENFDELTNPMLLELVDKVLVHERDKKYSHWFFKGKLKEISQKRNPTVQNP